MSTRQFVARDRVSANALQTTMPASIQMATSRTPAWSLNLTFRMYLKTKVYTSRFRIGKITDQKKPMEEPT